MIVRKSCSEMIKSRRGSSSLARKIWREEGIIWEGIFKEHQMFLFKRNKQKSRLHSLPYTHSKRICFSRSTLSNHKKLIKSVSGWKFSKFGQNTFCIESSIEVNPENQENPLLQKSKRNAMERANNDVIP